MNRKQRIVLVDPPLSLKKRYAFLGGAGQLTPPIGLLYLASYCRKQGFAVSLMDANALGADLHQIVRLILESKADFVGIGAHTLSVSTAGVIAKELKKARPEIVVIIGGAHISSCSEETMQRYTAIDAGVIGEGEQTLVELMEAITRGSDLQQVDGIIFRQDDRTVRTRPRQRLRNLDELPMPAWDLLPSLKKYKLSATRFSRPPVGSIITSRGCPGQCTFCDRSVFGQAWRGHGPDYVLEMIDEMIKRHRIRSLVINDDTFVLDPKRLTSICEGMIKSGMNLSWSCSARIDEMDGEMLKLMKRAGCFQIAYGLESGSNRILKAMKKRVSTESMRKVVEETKRADIRSKGYFIIGYPGETRETIKETIDFALSLPLNDAQFTFLTPFPGTEVHRQTQEKGESTSDWEKMNMWETTFVPSGLSMEVMNELRNAAFRKFYLRPRIIASYASLLCGSPSFSLSLTKDFLSFLRFLLKK